MDYVPKQWKIPVAVTAYSLCSGTMLLFNKLAMYYVPVPSFVTVVQLLFAIITVYALQAVNSVPTESMDWPKVKAYLIYTVAFVLGVYCNMRALENSNVETVIIFRSCTPIAVAVCDYFFMGRELPSRKSSFALFTISAGAYMYVASDAQFKLDGVAAYSWAILYFVMICFEMLYGKKITNGVTFNSIWGNVLFTNLFSVMPMFLLGYLLGDYEKFKGGNFEWSIPAIAMLVLSSIVGTLIGYTGWAARGLVSATSYTLVGVINKFITILLNVLIWDKHATGFGIMALVVSLAGGAFYEQAPMRLIGGAPGRRTPNEPTKEKDEVEMVPLMDGEGKGERPMPSREVASMA